MKKYFFMLLFTAGISVYGADLFAPKKSNASGPVFPETLMKYFSETRLNFQPMSPKLQSELLYDQRVVFLPGRSAPGYNKKSNYVGVYLGNGLFLDADYNLSILLDKYFQSAVTSKPEFNFQVTRIPKPGKEVKRDYSRQGNTLTLTEDKKIISEFSFEDDKIQVKDYHSVITPGDNEINYRVRARSLEWVDGKISLGKDGVDVSLDYPPGKIAIEGQKISFVIPSDFFRSEIYEFRPYSSFELTQKPDLIVIKTKSGKTTYETQVFQSKNGLFIISEDGDSYRIFKDDQKKIHVILLSPDVKKPDQEILIVDGLF